MKEYIVNTKFTVTCPLCKKERLISYSNYKFITIGRGSGLCKKCGYIQRENKKKVGFVETSFEMIIPTLKCCGCLLSFASVKLAVSNRCEKYETCANSNLCLDAVVKADWDGFTADCKGFVQREDIL